MTDPTPETPSDAPSEAGGADEAAPAAPAPEGAPAPAAPETVWGGAPTAPPAGWGQPAPPQAPPAGWSQPAPPQAPPAGWGQPAGPSSPWAPPPPPVQAGPPAGWGASAAPPVPPADQAPPAPPASIPPMSPPPPAPGQAGWAQPAATAPGWAMSAAPSAQPEGSFTVALSGILLIIIGILVGLVGIVFLAGAGFLKSAIDTAVQNGDVTDVNRADLASTIEGAVAVIGALIGLFGLGDLIAGIGVLMKRQWGRIMGILLAFIAALLTTLVLAASFRALSSGSGGGFAIVTLVFAIAYWFIVVALARGGRAFRHA